MGQDLIAVLQSDELEDLQKFILEKESGFEFGEYWSCLSTPDAANFNAGVLKQVTLALATLHKDQETNETEDKLQALAVENLKVLIAWIQFIFGACSGHPDEHLIAAAIKLHDEALLGLEGASFKVVQDAVCKLCISWWQKDGPEKECLVAQTLPYTLAKALSSGKAADVKRVYLLRDTLKLFDFGDESSILDLKRLLLRAAFSPTFLKCADGRKFLPYTFCIDQQLVRELGAIIKNQIPGGRKSILASYGEILYRAWKEATGLCRLEIEDFVQGLMQASILSETLGLNGALRTVLDGFHSRKAQTSVDALLMRLYEPILFRGLTSANSNVRRNSLLVLFNAFPLQDPEMSSEEVDEMLTQQIEAVANSLTDKCSGIRAVAATGCLDLLDRFWELLPANITAGLLKRILGQLAFDAASPQVRTAVLSGLTQLISNPISHTLIKPHLKDLKALLWDPSVSVRCTFADLLSHLKKINALSITDLAAPGDLLDSLSRHDKKTGAKLQRLLLPAYFPDTEEGPSIVAHLLRIHPEAGQAFCSHLAALATSTSGVHLSLERLEGLARALKDHLLASPVQKTVANRPGKRKKKASPEQLDGAGDGETEVSWQSILRGLLKLCEGISKSKKESASQLVSHNDDQQQSKGRALSDQGLAATWLAPDDLCSLYELAPHGESKALIFRLALTLPYHEASRNLRNRFANLEDESLEASHLHAMLQCLVLACEDDIAKHCAQLLAEIGTAKCKGQCLDMMLRDPLLRGCLLGPDRGEGLDDTDTWLKTCATQFFANLKGGLDAQSDMSVPMPAIGNLQQSLGWNPSALRIRFALHRYCAANQLRTGEGLAEGAAIPDGEAAAQLQDLQRVLEDVLKDMQELQTLLPANEICDELERKAKEQKAQSEPRQKRSKKARTTKSALTTHQDPLMLLRQAIQGFAEVLTVLCDSLLLLPSALRSSAGRQGWPLCHQLLHWLDNLSLDLSTELLGKAGNSIDHSTLIGLSMRLLALSLSPKPLQDSAAPGSSTDDSVWDHQDRLASQTLAYLQKSPHSAITKSYLKPILEGLLAESVTPDRWLLDLCKSIGKQLVLEDPGDELPGMNESTNPQHACFGDEVQNDPDLGKENVQPDTFSTVNPRKDRETSAKALKPVQLGAANQQRFLEELFKANTEIKGTTKFLVKTAESLRHELSTDRCWDTVLGALHLMSSLVASLKNGTSSLSTEALETIQNALRMVQLSSADAPIRSGLLQRHLQALTLIAQP